MNSTPYTYLLKHIPTGKVYYGCRFAKKCSPDDFWKSYFTSSKYVKELISKYGKESFVFEIRKTFSNVDTCRLWESKVLKRLNVLNRQDIFINKTDNISISPECSSKAIKGKFGKDCPAFGRKRPDVALRNKQNSGEKHYLKNNGEKSFFYGKKGALHPNYGKKNDIASEIMKQILTCPHCNKTISFGNAKRWHFNNCKNKTKGEIQ